MKKLIKKLVLWHSRNYRLNTPEKIFKHLSKHFYDYNYFICVSLDFLHDKGAIKETNYLKAKRKLIEYGKIYVHEFGGKYREFSAWWLKPHTSFERFDTIENKKKFLRFIAEKEGKK
jgi:hypothetical protein